MKPLYFPYDIIVLCAIVVSLGFIFRIVLRHIVSRSTSRLKHWFPFACSLIITLIIITFATSDLPIKFYQPSSPSEYDPQKNIDGPNMGAGLIAMALYVISLIVNLALAGISIAIIYIVLSRTTKEKSAESIDNDLF